jgi:2-oxoglutarate dehydrogenase E1 component
MERFLQLAAEDNIQICQPSTSGQYFHLLRRQALRRWRKPLIVFTPKSMLRLPDACSAPEDFTSGRFLPVLPENQVRNPERVVLCTGKVGRTLRAERTRRQNARTAIVFVEQLYPFPGEEIAAEIDRFRGARELVWVQEEPANMGALFNILTRLRRIAGDRHVLSVKRSSSPSPATGSAKAHEVEQKTLLTLAFTTKG